MGNCLSLSLSLDPLVNKVSQWLGEEGGYIKNLKKNLVVLEKTMEDLIAKRDTLLRRLIREEERGQQRLAEIQVWLTRVETIENIVNNIELLLVSKELYAENIQDEIAQKVGLCGVQYNQKGKLQKTDVLYNFLRKKRFMLFLDDLWEKVDLAKISVPFPKKENKCKVAFTTRSQDVCARMGVEDPMEVQCLEENEAFELFQMKVGKITLGSDPDIPDLARIVARKCSGLPLALDVIGETMSCKRTTQEWRHAIEVLTSNAAEFSYMEDKILPLLKYSYDSLNEEEVKSSLLYCTLFREDARIPKKQLIKYWTCEGIIDASEGIEKAENKGYEIIGILVRASLLLEDIASESTTSFVYMHDVVREMALWIASELGVQKNNFIVCAGVGLCGMPKVENWSIVRRMSLMDNKIRHLDGSPTCMELTTLLLQRTELANISSEFFKSMPKLVILDLSNNYGLELLDEISELVSLQYLNLSFTYIRHLPKGLQSLKKLIHLDLESTPKLSSIAGISCQHNFNVLKSSGSGFSWDLNTEGVGNFGTFRNSNHFNWSCTKSGAIFEFS